MKRFSQFFKSDLFLTALVNFAGLGLTANFILKVADHDASLGALLALSWFFGFLWAFVRSFLPAFGALLTMGGVRYARKALLTLLHDKRHVQARARANRLIRTDMGLKTAKEVMPLVEKQIAQVRKDLAYFNSMLVSFGAVKGEVDNNA
jgi:hypothetical protein